MISYLQGTIQSAPDKTVILNVNGVGYLVHVTAPLHEKLAATYEAKRSTPAPLPPSEPAKEETALFIHTRVREDDISLYGFQTATELSFFKTLIGINGIGPKLALEILSAPIAKVQKAILTKDIAWLSKIPGIGKKTAERIALELKGKMEALPISDETLADLANMTDEPETEEAHEDVIVALTGLGYQRHHVLKTLKKLPDQTVEVEEIVTWFLKNA